MAQNTVDFVALSISSTSQAFPPSIPSVSASKASWLSCCLEAPWAFVHLFPPPGIHLYSCFIEVVYSSHLRPFLTYLKKQIPTITGFSTCLISPKSHYYQCIYIYGALPQLIYLQHSFLSQRLGKHCRRGGRRIIREPENREFAVILCLEGVPEATASPIQLSRQELNKDNNRHANPDARTLVGPQPYTRTDKEFWEWEK